MCLQMLHLTTSEYTGFRACSYILILVYFNITYYHNILSLCRHQLFHNASRRNVFFSFLQLVRFLFLTYNNSCFICLPITNHSRCIIFNFIRFFFNSHYACNYIWPFSSAVNMYVAINFVFIFFVKMRSKMRVWTFLCVWIQWMDAFFAAACYQILPILIMDLIVFFPQFYQVMLRLYFCILLFTRDHIWLWHKILVKKGHTPFFFSVLWHYVDPKFIAVHEIVQYVSTIMCSGATPRENAV